MTNQSGFPHPEMGLQPGNYQQREEPALKPLPAPPPRKRGRRRWVASVLLAWTMLVASGAFVGGWALKDYVQAGRVTDGPTVVEVPAAVEVASGAMPDIRGLSLADAKQALVDSGFPAGTVEVTGVDWAGAEEVVIAQDPVVGEVASGTIKLQVSRSALMPDVVGMRRADAIDKLKQLGAETEVEEVFTPDKPAATVLSTDTKSGGPLPLVVTLQVAQAGSSLYLSTLDTVTGRCSQRSANVNATTYPNSLLCASGEAEASTHVWLINRKAAVLAGTLGVVDSGDTNAQVTAVFLGDGEEIGSATAGYAKPAVVSVDVTGVLRLEVAITSAKRDEAVLGDFMLKGTTADINQLERP